MINDQLLVYVRGQLALNISREAITANLKLSGWSDDDINEVFGAITASSVPASVPTSQATVVKPNIPEPITVQQNMAQTGQEQPADIYSEQHQSKRKKILSIVLILVLLCAAGASGYAYYSGSFVSLPSLTSEALDKARSSTSGSFDTTISIDFSEMKEIAGELNKVLSGGLNSAQLSLTTKGSFDIRDSTNKKSIAVISANISTISLAAEMRVVDNTFYGVLTKAPTIGFLPVLSAYENKWYSFPFNSEDGKIVNNPITSTIGVDPNITTKITPEQREHIYQLSRNAHFIKTVHKLTPETVGGEMSYHFAFDLDREGISSYLKSLKEYVNSVGKNDSELSAFDPTSAVKALDNVKDFKGEIWIGRNDKLLHKVMLNFGVAPDLAKAEQIKVTVVGIMSGWNQPVSIIAPAESTPFETLVSASLEDAKIKGKVAAIKAHLANMRAQAELFWDSNKPNSYSGFCLSKELKTARTAIEESGGKEFYCKDKAAAYAIAAKLPDDTGYWCADSTGFSKQTKKSPSGTACPVE